MNTYEYLLNKASQMLLEAEIRLNTIKIQVQELDRQIALIRSFEAHLRENIAVLQRKRAIVVVHEFKKAKEDLQTAINRTAILKLDRDKHFKIQVNYELVHQKAKFDYDKAFDKVWGERENNVISVNFGRKL